MNGLKIIRKKCGYSLEELAKKINVTKQAISMWETDKLDISYKRKKELSELFGIEIRYFNKLNEKELSELSNMPVYHEKIDKYSFKPKENGNEFDSVPIYNSFETSNVYPIAVKRKKDVLNQICDKFYLPDDYSKLDKTCRINRICDILELVVNVIEPQKKSNEKIPYFYFVKDVLNQLNDVVLNGETNSKIGIEMLNLLNQYIMTN